MNTSDNQKLPRRSAGKENIMAWQVVEKNINSGGGGYMKIYSHLFAVIVSKSGDLYMTSPVLKALGYSTESQKTDGAVVMVDKKSMKFAIKREIFAPGAENVFKVDNGGGHNNTSIFMRRMNPASFTRENLQIGGVYLGKYEDGMAVFDFRPHAFVEQLRGLPFPGYKASKKKK